MIRSSVGVALAALCLAACTPKEEVSMPVGDAQPGMGAATLNDFKAAMPVKEIMAHMVDYNAFGVWNRQGWLINMEGTHELFPTTDAEWMAAESAAISLAESANVLLLPGRPQDNDRRWVDYAHALYDSAMLAQSTAQAAGELMAKGGAGEDYIKAKQAFFDAGGTVYEACLQCHNHYIVGDAAGPAGVLPPLPNRTPPSEANPPATAPKPQ
jgi:hypothetical protein